MLKWSGGQRSGLASCSFSRGLVGIVFFSIRRQGETARRWGLTSLKRNKTPWSQRRRAPSVKFVFRPMGSVYELLFSKHALLRSLWAEPRL